MSDKKTPRELLKQYANEHGAIYDVNDKDSPDDACYATIEMVEMDTDNVCLMIQEYADQETAQLKQRIQELEKFANRFYLIAGSLNEAIKKVEGVTELTNINDKEIEKYEKFIGA